MYILEGNIGAGKSTFLRLIGQHLPEVKITLEPINNWQHCDYGQSLLTHFYENPNRWAYTFEFLTMICRIQDHLKEQVELSAKIMERSIYSGYYCFAHNSYTQGFMSDVEWQIYQQWFSFLILNKCQAPRGFIYMRVSPKIAYERIKKRNRDAEKTLSFTYLKQIHKCHELFLLKKEGILPHLKRVPVLVLNCDQDFEHNEIQLKQHMQKIQSFLTQTGAFIAVQKYKSLSPTVIV